MGVEVYDVAGNRLNEYDLDNGKLTPSTKTVHHEAVAPVEEVSHWEEKKYPNGGISRRKIIEQEAAPGADAWDEEIAIYVYTPYTPKELEAIEEEKNRPTPEKRLSDLEEALQMILAGVTE